MENAFSITTGDGDRKPRTDGVLVPQNATSSTATDRAALTQVLPMNNIPLSPRVFEYPIFPFSPNDTGTDLLDSMSSVFEPLINSPANLDSGTGGLLNSAGSSASDLKAIQHHITASSSSSLFPASNTGQDKSTSTEIVRRDSSNQLVTADANNHWPPYTSITTDITPADKTIIDPTQARDEENRLMEKAKEAQLDSKGKNKEIPPFVKKLEAYLSNDSNRNLIRWSDDGKSFIILDDETFAKTLIPQRFKHNNYASFVRQLNMYGFHKRIGLEDGSLMSNELGAKTPHTYDHPYFQRDKPELQWLIMKARSSAHSTNTTSKRKRGLSEDDGIHSDDDDDGRAGDGDTITISRSEWNMMKSQLSEYQLSAQQMQANTQHFIKALQDLKNDSELEKSITRQRIHALEGMSRQQAGTLSTILSFISKLYANHSARTAANQALNSGYTQMISPRSGSNPSNSHAVYNHNPSSSQLQMTRGGRRPIALLPAPVNTSDTSTSPLIMAESPASTTLDTPEMSTITVSSPTPNYGRMNHVQPSSSNNNGGGSRQVSASVSDSLVIPSSSLALAESQIESSNTATPGFTSQTSPSSGISADLDLGRQSNLGGSTSIFDTNDSDFINPLEGLSNLPPDQQFSHLTDHLAKQGQRMRGLVDRIEPLTPNGTIPGLGMTDSSSWDKPGVLDWNQLLNNAAPSGIGGNPIIATDLFPNSGNITSAGGVVLPTATTSVLHGDLNSTLNFAPLSPDSAAANLFSNNGNDSGFSNLHRSRLSMSQAVNGSGGGGQSQMNRSQESSPSFSPSGGFMQTGGGRNGSGNGNGHGDGGTDAALEELMRVLQPPPLALGRKVARRQSPLPPSQ